MTTPKVNTIKRGGSRFYVSPETGEKVPGVTSILDMLPKPYLKYWAAKVVAETAVRDVVALMTLVESDPDGAIDYLKRAPTRDTKRAADAGTIAHDYFERMAKGEEITEAVLRDEGKVEALPFVQHFQNYLDHVQPEYQFLEETVWSDEHAYAGSFDAFAVIDGQRLWLDNKTTRSGVHEEVGLQLAAYRFADNILRPDGTRVPMPRADGGAVVHVRPEGWELVPVKCGDEEFQTFLYLREVFDYETIYKKDIIGKPVAGNRTQTGPKRVTPKRPAPRTRRRARVEGDE